MEIVQEFNRCPGNAWNMYEALSDWKSREEVANELYNNDMIEARSFFLKKYQEKMVPYIRDDFYNDILYNEKTMLDLINKYQLEGSIDVPFLKETSLGKRNETFHM